jgi:TolA-binding protein
VTDIDDSADARTVKHLIVLARNQLTEEAPKRGVADLLDVERALDRHRHAGRARIWIGRGATAGALLAIAAAVVLLLPATRPPTLMVEVLNGAVSATGHVDGTSRGTTLSFSDGTRLALAEQARARVAEITAHGAELELERGKVNVHVVPLPESRWTLRAGAHRVNVTGTEFDLEFDPEDQSLSLDLETGSVTVNGPLIDGELRLKAGELLQVQPSKGGVRVVKHAERDVSAAVEATRNPADDLGVAPHPASPRDEPKAKPASPSDWRELVAAGRFDEVIALAERRGLTRVHERAGLEELEALADAARYLKRNDEALTALRALRARFAGSRPAREAAFFLGRIEEDRNSPSRALEHYARYLEESPNGFYASHALGRKLMIVVGREGAERAQQTAQEYVKLFPNGPHAAIARDVLEKRTTVR